MSESDSSSEAQISAPQQFRHYRHFLAITQAQLGEEMGISETVIRDCEDGASPISAVIMGQLRALVVTKLVEEFRLLFLMLGPKLGLEGFEGLYGIPDTGFSEDTEGNLYLGSVIVYVHEQHPLYIRVEDRQWYGLDGEGFAARLDDSFIKSVLLGA